MAIRTLMSILPGLLWIKKGILFCFMMLSIASLSANSLNAMGATFFDIVVDGKEVFTGSIFHGPDEEHYDEMAQAISIAKINSFVSPPMPAQDISLEGDITIQPKDLPSMRLRSLRLIHIEEDGAVYTLWKISPVDATKIEAYYKPIAERRRANDEAYAVYKKWEPILIPVLAVAGAAIFLIFLVVFLYAKRHSQRSSIPT